MTSALVILHIVEIAASFLIALLMRTLYRQFDHQEHLKYWAWSWLIMSAALIFPLPIFFMGSMTVDLRITIPLVVVTVLIFNFQAPMIALAALSLGPEPPSRTIKRLVLASGGATSIVLFVLVAAFGGKDPDSAVRFVMLSRVLLAITLAWYVLASIRYLSRYSALAEGITIVFCTAFAIHEFLFGISGFGWSVYNRDNQILASIAGAVLPLGITIGIVMTVMEEAMGVEQQFRKVWEASLDGMCLIDPDGVFRKVNESFCRLLGSAKSELEGKPFTVVYPVSERDRLLGEYRLFFAAPRPVSRQISRMERLDGREMWVDTSAVVIESGHQKLLLCVVRDVTEAQKAREAQQRSDEALRESEERYRLVAQNVTDVIWTLDLNLRRTFISHSVTQARGFTVEEVMAQPLESSFAPDSFSMFRSACEEELLLEKKGERNPFRHRTLEIELVRKDGSSYWAETKVSLLRDSGGKAIGFLGVTRDISERRQSEATQRRLEAQVRQSQKMEAIGTLAGGIAHDFNNILTIISGFTELAIRNPAMRPDELRQTLNPVVSATNRAKDLVKQILTFSRMGDQERRPVRLDLLIKEALKFLRASIPSTIEMESSFDSASLIAMADPTQIHQILMNLCANASHAMRERENGTLKVELKKKVLGCGSVDDSGEEIKAGTYAHLIVADNGPGISPQIISRIFEPFFTTKPKGEGTGLGLSVVHGIVKSHGGFIKVSSQPGQGAVFEILLPLLNIPEVEEIEKDQFAIPRGRGERILVVDDEAEIARIHEQFLKQLGYRVTTETDSLAALELFRRQPELHQVVITDQTMPIQTGLNLAAEILKIRPETPIILCTGFSDQISAEKIKEYGIRELLYKPIRLREIADALARLLKPV